MKTILFVALVAAGAWWYFIGGRQLDEAQVRAFYLDLESATLARKPEALCDMLADQFTGSATLSVGPQTADIAQDRAESCENYRQVYIAWDALGEKMGGILQLDAEHTIHGISISADRKTATVDISSSLDVAGSIFNLRARTTDTVIRRNGKVLLLRSDGQASASSGS